MLLYGEFAPSTIELLAKDAESASYVKLFRYAERVFGYFPPLLNMTSLTNLSVRMSFEDNDGGIVFGGTLPDT